MLVELTQVRTADGLTHQAHYYPPAPSGDLVDSKLGMVVVHGSAGNLAAPWLRAYAERFSRLGLGVVCANNRGHDIAWAAPGGRGYRGNAFERIEDCRLDLEPTIDLAIDRGARAVILMGHSLGAVKILYYQGERQDGRVAGMIPTSPPRLSYTRFLASEDAAVYRAHLERAQRLVAEGRPNELIDATHPNPTLYSAATYLNKQGPEERANVFRYAPMIRCPLLLMGGTAETHSRLRDFPRELYAAATGAAARELRMLEGAGHDYADKLPIALDHAERWLRATVLGRSAASAAAD